MSTPVELINMALKQAGVLGVGQTATAEDLADCFKLYNMMLAQWSMKRSIVHQIVDLSKTATGALTYTVGPGGDFDTPWVSKVVSGYARQLNGPGNPVDYPMNILSSASDWGKVNTKEMGSMPLLAWYDPQFPIGILHVWPVPTSLYQIHIQCLKPLPVQATAFDDIILPPEYDEAIMFNLAGRICSFYQLPIPEGLPTIASAALNTLRSANLQLDKLYMPGGLVRGGGYNVYSDI